MPVNLLSRFGEEQVLESRNAAVKEQMNEYKESTNKPIPGCPRHAHGCLRLETKTEPMKRYLMCLYRGISPPRCLLFTEIVFDASWLVDLMTPIAGYYSHCDSSRVVS